jgi:rod shape determining protein RodA
MGSALLIAIILMFFDTRFYTFFAYVFYVPALLILLAVAFLGKEVNGSRSWFEIAGFHFQPTEFAKVATCMAVAKYLSSYSVKIRNLKSLIIVGIIIFLPAALIMLQPDLGSVIVSAAFVFVLYREGFPGEYLFFGFLLIALFVCVLVLDKFTIIIILAVTAILGLGVLNRKLKDSLWASVLLLILCFFIYKINILLHWHLTKYSVVLISITILSASALIYYLIRRTPNILKIILFLFVAITFTYSVDYVFNNFLKPHQRERVNILLGKESDPRGAEYNVNQSKIAIGSGGFTGKGYLQGTQTKFNFVPEQSTDFIFCTVGEEWGFLGSVFIIAIFFGLLMRLIYLAERQRSTFSRIYGYGVVSILFLHVAINIGMTIELLPVIGIPLPFFSYGGSSLWAFTILIFIFLRLDASRLELLK